jgi:hypothetical protein
MFSMSAYASSCTLYVLPTLNTAERAHEVNVRTLVW